MSERLLEFRRGDVVRARFDPIEGSEQGGTRPALILSPTRLNRSGSVVLVAAITSRKTDNVYPYETFLSSGEGGLNRDSKVMLRHLRSMNKVRLTSFLGQISDETMNEVDAALKIAVGLEKI